jgi:hypothetical protein
MSVRQFSSVLASYGVSAYFNSLMTDNQTAKYRLDLVGMQKVKEEKGNPEQGETFIFFIQKTI